MKYFACANVSKYNEVKCASFLAPAERNDFALYLSINLADYAIEIT